MKLETKANLVWIVTLLATLLVFIYAGYVFGNSLGLWGPSVNTRYVTIICQDHGSGMTCVSEPLKVRR